MGGLVGGGTIFRYSEMDVNEQIRGNIWGRPVGEAPLK